jgi:hypothetical protein
MTTIINKCEFVTIQASCSRDGVYRTTRDFGMTYKVWANREAAIAAVQKTVESAVAKPARVVLRIEDYITNEHYVIFNGKRGRAGAAVAAFDDDGVAIGDWIFTPDAN